MSIPFSCLCGHRMIAKDEHAGRKSKCTSCLRELVIPPAPVQVAKPALPKAKRASTKGLVIVRRAKRLSGSSHRLTVYLDGEDVGTVRNGDEEEFDLRPGTHTVEVSLSATRSQAFRVQLMAGEEVEFECEVVNTGAVLQPSLRCVRKPTRDAVAEAKSSRPQQSGAGNGGLILLFGFLSFCAGIFGIAALAGGVAHMGKVSSGEYDSSGVAMAIIGMVLGIIGFLANVFCLIVMVLAK